MTDNQMMMEKIQEADMVLIGLGEEFDTLAALKKQEAYNQIEERLKETDKLWMLPACESLCREKEGLEESTRIACGLEKLAAILQDKNYFVISSSCNDSVSAIPWKQGRFSNPCGGWSRKQCLDGCAEGLLPVIEKDREHVRKWFDAFPSNMVAPDLGCCPVCGKPLIFNNIYAEHYDENGYLADWQTYRKWLQGSMNRKIVLLELGVGMRFPSVIRWPFEKIVFYQEKAFLYRVNGHLYQLTEEMKGKAVSIPENAIDWLMSLC